MTVNIEVTFYLYITYHAKKHWSRNYLYIRFNVLPEISLNTMFLSRTKRGILSTKNYLVIGLFVYSFSSAIMKSRKVISDKTVIKKLKRMLSRDFICIRRLKRI